MATFFYLFKDDAPDRKTASDMGEWGTFVDGLRKAGHFVGGGPLGEGCLRRAEQTSDEVSEFAGYMVVTADILEQATALLDGCPTTRGGGTVEVRHVLEV